MSTRRSVLAAVGSTLVLAACASVDVRTATSPDANFGSLRTFNVMPHPTPTLTADSSANDPLLVNSISSRALRADVYKGFENRGYTISDTPDFVVAYYASAKTKLDVTYWDYGYPFYGGWWGGWGPGWDPPGPVATQFTQGTVILDVLNAKTKELLWRGQGVAQVSDDESKYEQDLWNTVTAILDKFPRVPQG
jgi:hypothetical protein